MNRQDRMPKADYFRKRYADAVENGLTSKVDYYRGRLEQMGEPIRETKMGTLTRSEFFGGDLVIYSW